MAHQKPSFGHPLRTKVHKVWNLRAPEKWLKNRASKISESYEKTPKWVSPFASLGVNFETLRQTGARRRRTAQNRPFFIKIQPKSRLKTRTSEFSLFSSQHLWRTWGPQDGAKFRTLRSFLFLANPWEEPRSCTSCTFLGVRRCHAARRLQYYIIILMLS